MQQDQEGCAIDRSVFLRVGLVGLAAVLMGLPTLRGTFVGADDHRLVLNHVLVNHPSLEHAWRLITIVHRDLYQPIPLLSFSAEFLLAGWLGLFDKGVEHGAWLFHLTNICLHALNAILVWAVVGSLTRKRDGPLSRWTPVVAGILFAVHPLQVEVVAWINGRMMLLSTLFALLSVLTMSRWLRTTRGRWAWLTAVMVLLCAVSKIRVGLPILLLLVALAGTSATSWRQRYSRRFVLLWGVCVAIVGAFAVVNYNATADAGMFEGAVGNLHGPEAVRALLALAWYFQHYIIPVGLASWYPTPVIVSWGDPATLRAIVIVAGSFLLLAWACWKNRYAALGVVWFFATIAVTVQLVPTRNALAADRYMYLPIVGLAWATSVLLTRALESATFRRCGRYAGSLVVALGGGLAAVFIGVSWHTASFYESPVGKGLRIAELFPTVSHVWERVAWAYYHDQRYDEAIDCARKEFDLDDPAAEGAAHQVIALSLLRQGLDREALDAMDLAIATDPKSSNALYNKARMLLDLNRPAEALPYLEESVAKAPLANPRIRRLASLYRRIGRLEQSREMYGKILLNNPYDPRAIRSLAELDIAKHSKESLDRAIVRLEALLDWMPENTDARVALGVALHGLGRTREAVVAYELVLTRNPRHATAAFNLAGLHYARGDVRAASRYFQTAVSAGLESIDQAVTVHDFLIQQQQPQVAVSIWSRYLDDAGGSTSARTFLAWSHALAGDEDDAARQLNVLPESARATPLATAVNVLLAARRSQFTEAAKLVRKLDGANEESADARGRLRRSLAWMLAERPNDPWPYCLAASLWIFDERHAEARTFIDLCRSNCAQADCRAMIAEMDARLSDAQETP